MFPAFVCGFFHFPRQMWFHRPEHGGVKVKSLLKAIAGELLCSEMISSKKL